MDGTTKMTVGTGRGQPLALRLLLKLLTRIRVGKLRVVAPDGTPHVFQGESGPEATIILRHVDTARRVLFGGDLGLAEAYMDGQWETPDLMAFLELGQRNMQALSVDRPRLLHRMLDSLVHALRRNTR
ncbi:MAG TPA: SAM-dependent methyltransferase, partial [Gammaproteobacteria bacterium]|nr:SAM-dependent methyltransferase [Gammaproteobacteria bacterium]